MRDLYLQKTEISLFPVFVNLTISIQAFLFLEVKIFLSIFKFSNSVNIVKIPSNLKQIAFSFTFLLSAKNVTPLKLQSRLLCVKLGYILRFGKTI